MTPAGRLGEDAPPGSALMQAAREWHELSLKGDALLGARGWTLLRTHGRLTTGPHSGHYVSALSADEVHALLQALGRGERIPVHLMHRHRSGDSELSCLCLVDGKLVMNFADRTESAE